MDLFQLRKEYGKLKKVCPDDAEQNYMDNF